MRAKVPINMILTITFGQRFVSSDQVTFGATYEGWVSDMWTTWRGTSMSDKQQDY
jgi:hypothetical protein